MSRTLSSPIASTSPLLISTITGAFLALAARQTAIRVSLLSRLKAPTAKCSARARSIRARAFWQLFRISLSVSGIFHILPCCSRASHLDAEQGENEKRTESYMQYVEGVSEFSTKLSVKS